MKTQRPHLPGYCVLCDMYENVGHWGPPVGRVPEHIRLDWPDEEEVYYRETDSEGQDG